MLACPGCNTTPRSFVVAHFDAKLLQAKQNVSSAAFDMLSKAAAVLACGAVAGSAPVWNIQFG